jgi:hypothetical protein
MDLPRAKEFWIDWESLSIIASKALVEPQMNTEKHGLPNRDL